MISIKITTEYSLLKSLIKINDLVSFAIQNNISSLCICDNEPFGFMPFYLECKKNNIKPIIGLEILIDDTLYYIYPKNYQGYLKLLKINTLKYDNKVVYENIIDDDLLIVVPYQFYDPSLFNPNFYIGYTSSIEKEKALLLTSNIIYAKQVRMFKKEDIKYLNILNNINPLIYNENEYLDINNNIEEYNNFTNKINIEIPMDNKYLPKYKEGIDSFKYLKTLAYKGLEKRIGTLNNIYTKRLDEELDIINNMGFLDYFLIVYDYVLYAKKNNILVGPGRGSAAGSLVSFSIGITDIDPIKYDLLFARFLNPARAKMPDIDIDFEDSKRSLVIDYVKKTYGDENVALGLTFNTYKSRLVLRDVAKVLKIDNDLLEKFLFNIDPSKTLKENKENPTVQKYLKMYKDLDNLYDISIHLEGLKKNISTHAAGVIICPTQLDDIIPIYKDESGIKTGYAMEYMEMQGLLKMDFLGLSNLSFIVSLQEKLPNIDFNNIPFDDKKTFELLQRADTDNIFQLESNYAKNNLKKLQVKSFTDLINAIALVRPGPSDQIDAYITNDNEDDNLKDILQDTHGTIIFQEQVMQIFMRIASYTSFEADSIRNAMSKKKIDVMNKEKDIFINKSINNGYTKEYATKLFDKMQKFSEYGFNKAHSVSYATICYKLAYIKANYPIEFTITLLENERSSSKIKQYYDYLKSNKCMILKPNINLSTNEYKYKNNRLLLPLNSIKGLNQNIISTILDLRKSPYIDIYDFVLRCNSILNNKTYELLVYSGLLDTFKINKHTLIENYDILMNFASFASSDTQKPILTDYEEYDNLYLLNKENEIYGYYITNHPVSIYKSNIKLKDISNYLFSNIKLIVLVEDINKIKTKKGDNMAFIKVSDETSTSELTVFSSELSLVEDIKKNDIIEVYCKPSKRFDKISIIVNNIKRKS